MTDTTTEEPVTDGRGRARLLAVAAAVVAALLVAVVVWQVTGDDQDGQDGRGSATVPYDDPQQAGLITLCSDDGTAVTGGSVDDRPFADVALGETGVPADLDPTGAVVTLLGYQPRTGIGPEEFSGIPLTAAAPIAGPVPALRITDGVYSVRDFVTAYPATDDGFVQLRFYLGTPDAGTLTESPYDAADLRVDGDRWELVRGGTASCADATSVAPAP